MSLDFNGKVAVVTGSGGLLERALSIKDQGFPSQGKTL